MSETINTMSRIELLWSTNPSDVGYPDGRPKKAWETDKADFRGSPAQCLMEMRKIRKRVGESVFISFRIRHKGKLISTPDNVKGFLESIVLGY